MITIKLNPVSTEFTAGQSIDGVIHWTDLDDKSEKIEIRLIWYTSGKGDRDCEIIESKLITSPSTTGESSFSFLAPIRPYSFSGKLISLSWAIEAIVFPDLGAEQKRITVSPTGKEILLRSPV